MQNQQAADTFMCWQNQRRAVGAVSLLLEWLLIILDVQKGCKGPIALANGCAAATKQVEKKYIILTSG